jgi:hypothetical protein
MLKSVLYAECLHGLSCNMNMKLQYLNQSGFAILSLTLLLVFIAVSSSLSFAQIQQQRIQRGSIALNYQQAKIEAEMSLDLFYVALHDNAQLLQSSLALAGQCANSETGINLPIPANIISQYTLKGRYSLCLVSENTMDVTVSIMPYSGIDAVRMHRKLQFVGGQLVWLLDSTADF